MKDDLEEARWRFAEELRYVAAVRSAALIEAFATVPRERFVGPGPWKLMSFPRGYWTTEDSDPRHLYHNVLVGIDPKRHLNNGQPSLWALLFDEVDPKEGEHVLHIGCGTGYYSAILAEIVGGSGRVTAIEVDSELAARARANLGDWSNVEVICADGCQYSDSPANVLIVNAGASHPLPNWLDSLLPAGRMILPLTVTGPILTEGGVVKVIREERGYAARFVSPVGIFPCAGGRDPELNRRLGEALSGDRRAVALAVKSLRRDSHESDKTCWFHAGDFCFSTLPVPAQLG